MAEHLYTVLLNCGMVVNKNLVIVEVVLKNSEEFWPEEGNTPLHLFLNEAKFNKTLSGLQQ